MRYHLILFCIFLTLAGTNAFAQQNDARAYVTIGLEKKWTPGFSTTLLFSGSMRENYSEPGSFFADAGLKYRLTRNVTASIGYRYIQWPDVSDAWKDRYAWRTDLTYSKSKGKFGFSVRERYLVTYYASAFHPAEQYKDPKHYLRSRLMVRYAWNTDNTAYLQTEHYYRFDQKDMSSAWRFGAGIRYTFDLHQSVDISYGMYHQVNTQTPDNFYIFSLAYYLKF